MIEAKSERNYARAYFLLAFVHFREHRNVIAFQVTLAKWRAQLEMSAAVYRVERRKAKTWI